MVPAENVLPPAWTLPPTCPHCGQRTSANILVNAAPSVSSSAPPANSNAERCADCGADLSVLTKGIDGKWRCFDVYACKRKLEGSSAEPAPPTEKSSWLIVSGLVENATVRYYTADERADRGMCLSRWSANVNDARQYETREHADRVAKRLPHAAINPLRVEEHIWTDAGREKSSLSPVQEEATPTLDTARVTQIVGFLGDQRRTQSNMRFQLSHGDAEQLRLLASALPALLEASRRADSWKENYSAISDSLIKLQSQLAGSIRERETLTAQIAQLKNDASNAERDVSDIQCQLIESRAAVARLTTEKAALEADRDTFRDWFQNAEQARAVAIAERDRQSERAAQFERDLEVSEVQRAELLRSREQAIQDIEALPTAGVGVLAFRDAALSILRGATP